MLIVRLDIFFINEFILDLTHFYLHFNFQYTQNIYGSLVLQSGFFRQNRYVSNQQLVIHFKLSILICPKTDRSHLCSTQNVKFNGLKRITEQDIACLQQSLQSNTQTIMYIPMRFIPKFIAYASVQRGSQLFLISVSVILNDFHSNS